MGDRIVKANPSPIPPQQCHRGPSGETRLPTLPRDKTSLPFLTGVVSVEAMWGAGTPPHPQPSSTEDPCPTYQQRPMMDRDFQHQLIVIRQCPPNPFHQSSVRGRLPRRKLQRESGPHNTQNVQISITHHTKNQENLNLSEMIHRCQH